MCEKYKIPIFWNKIGFINMGKKYNSYFLEKNRAYKCVENIKFLISSAK